VGDDHIRFILIIKKESKLVSKGADKAE